MATNFSLKSTLYCTFFLLNLKLPFLLVENMTLTILTKMTSNVNFPVVCVPVFVVDEVDGVPVDHDVFQQGVVVTENHPTLLIRVRSQQLLHSNDFIKQLVFAQHFGFVPSQRDGSPR